MHYAARPLPISTSSPEDLDGDSSSVPTLTPLWNQVSGSEVLTPPPAERRLRAPSALQLRQLPIFAQPSAVAERDVEVAEEPHSWDEMERGSSLLFDGAGRSMRHTRGGAVAVPRISPIGRVLTSTDSLLHSPLMHGDATAFHSTHHAREDSFSRRTPAIVRSPVRCGMAGAFTPRSAAGSASASQRGEASFTTRGLRLRSQSEGATPVGIPLSPANWFVDKHDPTHEPCVEGESASSDEFVSVDDLNAPEAGSTQLDLFLSLGLRTFEDVLTERERAEEAATRRGEIIREVLFYLFIACCFCCFLFSWMMHRHHVSFIVPAYRRHWVPSQKSSALFRSGLYYLVLALVCRFDAAWLSVCYLCRLFSDRVRRECTRCRHRLHRLVRTSCPRMPWSRAWNRWQRSFRQPLSKSGEGGRGGDTARRDALASIRRVRSPVPRLSTGRGAWSEPESSATVNPLSENTMAAQVTRRWRSVLTAVLGLTESIRRRLPWVSTRLAAPPPSAAAGLRSPQKRRPPHIERDVSTLLL